MKKKLMILMAAVIMCTFFLHCDAHAVKVKNNKKTIYLKMNHRVKIRIKGRSRLPSWRSMNKAVAVPDGKGYIRAVAPGKTVVYTKVKYKKHKKIFKCKVVVMEMKTRSLYLKEGTSFTNKVIRGGKKVKWKSSDKSVAKVTDGKIKAKGPGTAVITATAHKKTFKCYVTVPEVKISKTSLVASPPEPGGVRASKSTAKITVKNYSVLPTYISATPEIATVDSQGIVTAIKKGTAVINVSVNGLVYPLSIQVSDRPVDIYLAYLKKYNKYVKKNGKLFVREDTPVESFQKAKTLVSQGKKVAVNCRAHCTWAFRDMGFSTYRIYAKNGTFASRYKGTMTLHLTRITTGGPIGMNVIEAVDSGQLKAGDICAFKGKTHTFTYSGEGYKFYDGGSVVEMKGYSKIGFLMDYSSVNYYEKKTIGEVLRWNY